MSDPGLASRIPLQVSRGCVVASVQTDLRSETLSVFQLEMLELIRTSSARGVIIDVSGLDTIDPEEFAALRRVGDMARLMGALPVICGLSAGVVSALVDLDVDFGELEATRTLDDAFTHVLNVARPEPRITRTTVQAFDEEQDADRPDP